MPEISVIMGIYNCADTLPSAIDSILAQTYTDWELIMCDDGSTDNTLCIAGKYAEQYPEKVILLKNECNRGLNKTLNICLGAAKGDYIARMDGDDTCSADRFEKEIAILKATPSLAVVSSGMAFFDDGGIWGTITHPEHPTRKDFLHGSPFCHAPCMMRRDAIVSVGGYSEGKRLLRVEDYHLWMKLYAAGYSGYNIPEILYSMRDDCAAYKRRRFRFRINESNVICLCVKNLRLPVYGYLYALKPIIVGLLPEKLYTSLHKRKLSHRSPK